MYTTHDNLYADIVPSHTAIVTTTPKGHSWKPWLAAHFTHRIFTWEVFNMPKKTTTRTDATPRFGDFRFINVRLGVEELASFDAVAEALWLDRDTLLQTLLTGGYKISLSYQQTNDSFSFTITAKEDEDGNTGLMMSSFSEDYQEAIAIGLYKHFELFKAGKWAEDTPTRSRG